MGRNPATGETIKIPAKKVVKFRVAKAAKDAILGKKITLLIALLPTCPPPRDGHVFYLPAAGLEPFYGYL